MTDLSQRIALVTGASRGIGRAAAIALARAGAHVAVHFHTARVRRARTFSVTFDALGRQSIVVQADVSKADHVTGLVHAVESGLGTIDILVNNAGITRPQPIEAITERDWDELIAVNLKSIFLVTQAALPAMRPKRWGRIVNLSSVAAQLGGVVGPHYAASKAGVLGLTHAYAALLAKEGITVNAIAPALVATDMVTSNPRATPALIPVGRFGSADEVAETVVWLVRNGYVTGQTINVNGGWYMS